MTSPAYFRAWRAAHPEYRERQRQLRAERRCRQGRESRAAEYRRRPSRAIPPVPVLLPALVHGSRLSFWEDELRLDIAQERALAALVGSDPDEAAHAYRARETTWQRLTVPFIEAAA